MDISNLSSASSLFVPCHCRSRARSKRMGTVEGLAAAPGFKRSSVKEASSTGSHMIDALTFADLSGEEIHRFYCNLIPLSTRSLLEVVERELLILMAGLCQHLCPNSLKMLVTR